MGALLAVPAARAAETEPFPGRAVHLIVPFPPGGGFDLFGRLLAARLAQRWGQPVLVENRPGAGGSVGSAAAARAQPDGYTLLLGHNGTLAVNPSLYGELGYDPQRDLAVVSPLASAPLLLLVPGSSPFTSLAELLARARQQPHALNYASSGSGSMGHMSAELLQQRAGVELTHIPYRGTAAALQDLLGARIDLTFSVLPAALPQLRTGRVRALAISSAERSPLLPELPTLAEAAELPGFQSALRYAVLAPAGTPAGALQEVRARIAELLASAQFRAELAAEGAEPLLESPEEFAAELRAEATRWRELIRARAIRAE